MKRRSMSWTHRRWDFSVSTALIVLTLAIFSSATSTGSDDRRLGNDSRGSPKGPESVKTIRESNGAKNNDPGTGSNEESGGTRYGTENRNNPNENNEENSPALNSFLENVLRAKDELKWIDEAVRKKESQDKFLDHVDPEGRAESEYTPSARRYLQESPLNDDYPAIDDSTLRDWTMEEGIQVPDGWFESDDADEEVPRNGWSRSRRGDESPGGLNKIGENRGDGDAESGTPTLESLKRTVLELSRSLGESEGNAEAANEREASRDRERHVEEISGRKEGRAKGEHERDSRGRSYSRAGAGLSSGASWRDDPRSAADIFDFRRRDDDGEESDDEEAEEDPDPEKSGFDYPLRVVKSASGEYEANETDDAGKTANVRVYRRSGFGESSPDFSVGYGYHDAEDHGREKRSGYEENVEEIKEIGEGPDKIGAVGGNDESERNGSLAANATKNDNDSVMLSAAEAKDGNNTERSSEHGEDVKKSVDDNRAALISEGEKSTGVENSVETGNTRADAPLTSTDGERSSVKKVESCDKGDKREPNGSSADEIILEENVHARSKEILKNKQSDENPDANVEETKEVEKSEPTDDAVPKLSANYGKEQKDIEEQRAKVENESHASGSETTKESRNFENVTNVNEELPKNVDSLGTNGKIVEPIEVESELFFNENGLDSDTARSGEDPSTNRGGSQRKLLWLSGDVERETDSKDSEIRDGRRDSAWDQKDDATRSVQRPANLIDSPAASRDSMSSKRRNSKFAKRSSKDARGNKAADSLDHRLEKFKKSPRKFADLSKTARSGARSSKSAANARENSPDEDPLRVALNEEGEADDGGRDHFEVRGRSARVPEGPQRQDRERDPMRDRINMLIKQKLDDRGKGKLTHVKREVRETDPENIEYYDYNSDVNANGNSDRDSAALDYDQKQMSGDQTPPGDQGAILITAQFPVHSTSGYFQGGGDPSATTTTPSNDAQEPMLKKDENAAEELRQETLRAQTNCKPPKQEFISDANLDQPTSNTEKPSPNEIIPENSIPGSKAEDEGVEGVGRNSDDRNDRRDRPAPPAESDSRESELRGVPDGRYRENEDSADRLKSVENVEGKDESKDPLEYSVNVHGKIDPESIDEILGTKSSTNTKNDEEKPDSMKEDTRYDDRNREGEYDSWKYEGFGDRSRSGLEQRPEEEDSDGLEPARTYSVDKKTESRSGWRYGDSARIEEEDNGVQGALSSPQNEFEEKSLRSKDASNFDTARSSSLYRHREARLAEGNIQPPGLGRALENLFSRYLGLS
ncbi:uncharacterized protein LOC125499777 [Athalia rosae]|uniref:uncharacterized protein LOC125499777 n=1 Tax=Athalia rosae TaxID=37344 RepID=UPI00203433E8|nr:uncharacterized protein LOC125499777 [Athalia rosae]